MTRLFFVVSSGETNEEIFETLEEAEKFREDTFGTEKESLLRVAIVKNAFFEEDIKQWNYEDHSDTFTFVSVL